MDCQASRLHEISSLYSLHKLTRSTNLSFDNHWIRRFQRAAFQAHRPYCRQRREETRLAEEAALTSPTQAALEQHLKAYRKEVGREMAALMRMPLQLGRPEDCSDTDYIHLEFKWCTEKELLRHRFILKTAELRTFVDALEDDPENETVLKMAPDRVRHINTRAETHVRGIYHISASNMTGPSASASGQSSSLHKLNITDTRALLAWDELYVPRQDYPVRLEFLPAGRMADWMQYFTAALMRPEKPPMEVLLLEEAFVHYYSIGVLRMIISDDDPERWLVGIADACVRSVVLSQFPC